KWGNGRPRPSTLTRGDGSLPLQQIHWLTHVMYAEVLRQRWVFFSDFFKHSVGCVAIREMPPRAGTQLGDVNRLGEIHLEEGALAKPKRDRVLCALGSFRCRTFFEHGDCA